MATDVALTVRERQVLDRLTRGMAYKQIAADLGVSPSTIRTHVQHAYRKLGVCGAAQATVAYHNMRGSGPPQGIDRGVVENVARSFDRLVAAIERRQGLTARQRRYVAAFEDHVRAVTPEQQDAARERMDGTLREMLAAAGVAPRGMARHADALMPLMLTVLNRRSVEA